MAASAIGALRKAQSRSIVFSFDYGEQVSIRSSPPPLPDVKWWSAVKAYLTHTLTAAPQ